ncbi:MAG: glycosyltransferase [Nitrospinae bacterium]|nr:glycosyltransferase [Nitrospinota bacterium]
MDPLITFHLLAILFLAYLCRLPFLNFPLDDDFAIYTYRARFMDRGFKWKNDLQIIGIPMWKMMLFDKVFSSPENGHTRIRNLQTLFHAAACLSIYWVIFIVTQNPWAAFTGGILYSFYGTSPDLTAGSFNFEQFYIPFILSGLAFLLNGSVFYAGLCFGFAAISKCTMVIYAGAFAPLVWISYGQGPTALFAITVASVVILSNLVEWRLGFWDNEAIKQFKTRMATTLRITKTKTLHFSVWLEIILLIKQTLPLWISGIAGLVFFIAKTENLWLATFIIVTLSNIVFQRAFSRYHYLPWLASLSLGSGLGMEWILQQDPALGVPVAGIYFLILAWNVKSLLFYYLKPTHPQTLVQYEKYDQYLYIPRLGKILKRLMRMRGESDERIFVWGTFSQLYHLTHCPAADNYLHYTIGPWDTPDLEGFYDSMIGGIIKYQPKYIIKTFPDLDMQKLEGITGLKYTLIKVVLARFPVYRLENSKSVANPLPRNWQEKMQQMEDLTKAKWHAPALCRDDLERGEITTAYKECQKLLRLNPDDREGNVYSGEIYLALNLPHQAEKAFEKAIELAPEWQHLRIHLANIKIQFKKFDEAIPLIQEEIRRFDFHVEDFDFHVEDDFLNGLIFKFDGNYEDAWKKFDPIRKQFPDRHDCWELEIECLVHLKNKERLKTLFEDAQKIHPKRDREWLHTKIAKAVAETESETRPEHETLNLYVQKYPGNGILQYAHASALEKSGNSSAAYDLFSDIIDSAENYPHIKANACFRMARLAPLEKKQELLKESIKLNPSHQGAQAMLSDLQEKFYSSDEMNTLEEPETPILVRPENPAVSVIVPNWNGMRFVGMCLDSLAKLHFKNFEVIVVDNGSIDGSRELIEEKYPWVRLIRLPYNKGFAIACNEGIKASNAEYVVLLNNDIEVTPDWLTELYEGMERHPECGMGTTKMMFLDNRDVFYNTGDLFHSWSAGGGRGQGEKDQGQYDQEEYVFGACAGAGIYRKELFQQIGLFDEDFFIFAEDVDLNMRSQLQGFQAVYLPKSKVYHIGTATVGLYSDRYVYLCKRNDILVLLKNYSLKMYFKYLYSIWKHQFADIKYFTYRGQGQVLLKSKWDALKLLPKMLFRRFQIQRTRTVPDTEIEKHIITD